MSTKQKVSRAWAIRYPRGGICIWHVSFTKRNAIDSFCDNGEHSEPDDWAELRKRGYRAVKVEVRESE